MKVYALSIVFVILLIAGLFLLFRVSFSQYFSRWAEIFRNKKKSVRQRRKEIVTGKKRVPFVLKIYIEAKEILTQTGRAQMFPLIIVATFVLGVAGVFIAIAADNVFLIPVLGLGLAALPVILVHAQEGSLTRRMNGKLKETVNVISNTYIETEDIVHSFKSNLELLKPPFSEACAEFVAEATFLQANIPKALRNLKQKIDNDQWREWCDVLIQCSDNKELKHVLPAIVDKIDDIISVQAEIDAVTSSEVSQFRTIIIIGAVMFALMALIEPVWFGVLVSHSFGKFIVALAAAIVIGTVAFAVKILKPVEYR